MPETTEFLHFEDDINGRKVILWCIDKDTTNPYSLYKKMGEPEMNNEIVKRLKEEGNIKPVKEFVADADIRLNLSANAVYLLEVPAK